MLTALILLQLLIPPSIQFFFGTGGGGGGCGCPCPVPPPIPICAPPPVCAQPAPCSTVSTTSYAQPATYPSYSPSYASSPSYSAAPAPFYQPAWSPAIPSYRPSYSTGFSVAPPPLVIPSGPSYVAPVAAPAYQMTPSIPLPGPLPPSPLYLPPPPPLPVVTDGYDKISIVTTLATTPSYQQSGYAPAAKLYEKQYDDDNSLERMASPLPIPIEIPKEVIAMPMTFDYRTSQVVTPSEYYKPAYVPSMSYMEEASEEGQLVEKQGYWTKGEPIAEVSSKYGQFENRHNILKRMKTENIPRTNNTCNSIKLANVMMRAIVEDVSVSKRMIQHATKQSFDGAKFDVFCAVGEFSYSIHSRKYCEVTKDEVTCFAFR